MVGAPSAESDHRPEPGTSDGDPRRQIMAIQVNKVDVWVGEIGDRPGGLGEKLDALSEVGANLEFVISRRAPEKPGTGVH